MSAEKSLKVIAERLENIETLMIATEERSLQTKSIFKPLLRC